MPVPSSRGASMGRLRLVDSRPIWVATSATSAGRRMLHSNTRVGPGGQQEQGSGRWRLCRVEAMSS